VDVDRGSEGVGQKWTWERQNFRDFFHGRPIVLSCQDVTTNITSGPVLSYTHRHRQRRTDGEAMTYRIKRSIVERREHLDESVIGADVHTERRRGTLGRQAQCTETHIHIHIHTD